MADEFHRDNVWQKRVAARLIDTPVAGKVFVDDDRRFIHYCQCGAEAGFGDGVDRKHGQLGTWYCRDHLPEGYLPS